MGQYRIWNTDWDSVGWDKMLVVMVDSSYLCDLALPGISDHESKVGVVIDACTYTSVVVEKLLFRYLNRNRHL